MYNKKKIYILLIAIISLVVITGCAKNYLTDNSTQHNDNSSLADIDNSVFDSIQDIRQNPDDNKLFITMAYVVKITTCPPCPPGAMCKPCMPNNIIISESSKALDIYPDLLTNTELIIFVDNPEKFELGTKYKFSIVRSNEHIFGDDPIYELVNYSILK